MLVSKEWSHENSSVLTYVVLLLVAVMLGALVVQLNRRARQRNFRAYAVAANRTLQLESCGGIKATSHYEYLLALATALRTQADLHNLELRPGEFRQVVTDAIETAYLLKRNAASSEIARGTLMLFASCLDPVMSKSLSGEVTAGDEAHFVGTAGGLTLLASAEWHPDSNADLVTCALSECAPSRGMIEYWRSTDQAHRDQVEAAFERVVRTALDPATATYVRHKVFVDPQEGARTAV